MEHETENTCHAQASAPVDSALPSSFAASSPSLSTSASFPSDYSYFRPSAASGSSVATEKFDNLLLSAAEMRRVEEMEDHAFNVKHHQRQSLRPSSTTGSVTASSSSSVSHTSGYSSPDHSLSVTSVASASTLKGIQNDTVSYAETTAASFRYGSVNNSCNETSEKGSTRTVTPPAVSPVPTDHVRSLHHRSVSPFSSSAGANTCEASRNHHESDACFFSEEPGGPESGGASGAPAAARGVNGEAEENLSLAVRRRSFTAAENRERPAAGAVAVADQGMESCSSTARTPCEEAAAAAHSARSSFANCPRGSCSTAAREGKGYASPSESHTRLPIDSHPLRTEDRLSLEEEPLLQQAAFESPRREKKLFAADMDQAFGKKFATCIPHAGEVRLDRRKRCDVAAWVEQLLRCQTLRHEEVIHLCTLLKDTLRTEPNCVNVEVPVTVAGDIHGQFYDLLELFRVGGMPPFVRYLFLGDYVDRGFYSVEVFCLVAALKILHPTKVYLLRGNHESRGITQVYGFYDECGRKYGEHFPAVWTALTDAFDFLPLTAKIENDCFCDHGGLSKHLMSIDAIQAINRFQEPPQEGGMCDLLWSDPYEEMMRFAPAEDEEENEQESEEQQRRKEERRLAAAAGGGGGEGDARGTSSSQVLLLDSAAAGGQRQQQSKKKKSNGSLASGTAAAEDEAAAAGPTAATAAAAGTGSGSFATAAAAGGGNLAAAAIADPLISAVLGGEPATGNGLDEDGWGPSSRGAGMVWGSMVTEKFLHLNGVGCICRAHQLAQDGYQWCHNDKVCTVFSAPNYCYRCGNQASLMLVNEHLERSFTTFGHAPERGEPQQVRSLPDYFL